MPVQKLNRTIRDDIYQRTLAAVRTQVGDHMLLVGNCLEFAWAGYQIIQAFPGAPRTIIQAGSAQWPRIPPELDDGISPTHFAYEWNPDSEVTRLFLAGLTPIIPRADGHTAASLPEMHVWLGCPDSDEIIDFTTGLWPAACQATLGLDWLGERPPDYIWTFGSRFPKDVRYIASREAIAVVIEVLRQQDREYP